MTIKTYGVNETPSDEIPVGYERVSLVQDEQYGDVLYQVEQGDGDFYLCDADGDKVAVKSWILLRVLADVPVGDCDGFFEAIEATAKTA